MNEYPEHIDQIDDFYRNQLADHEIEPPEGLWDKIKLGAFNTSNPEVEIAPVIRHGDSSNKTKKYLSIGAAALLFMGGVYLISNNNFKNTESKTPPSIEQPIESDLDSTSSIPSGSDKIIPSSSSSSSEAKKDNATIENNTKKKHQDHQLKEDEVLMPMPSEETQSNNVSSIPQHIQDTDSLTDITTNPKTVKEKVKFKDKYKKEYQDSTRNIFVPGK